MVKIVTTLLLVILLSACTPKYNYINPGYQPESIDHVFVMLDYTSFVDDVGEVYDYDMAHNKNRVDVLQSAITRILNDKGYVNAIDFALISSGVGFNPELAFEHYVGNELREDFIYPPFFINSPYTINSQDELIRSFIEAQRIALTTVSKDTQNYLQVVRLTPINLKTDLTASDNEWATLDSIAILHVRVLAPRISFVKAMGVSVISAGLTLGATSGAYIGMAIPMGRPHSTGLLFDNQTGQVVWKNQRPGDLSRVSDNGLNQFFKDFPVKP